MITKRNCMLSQGTTYGSFIISCIRTEQTLPISGRPVIQIKDIHRLSDITVVAVAIARIVCGETGSVTVFTSSCCTNGTVSSQKNRKGIRVIQNYK